MKASEFIKKCGWDLAKYRADELKIIEGLGDKISSQAKQLIEYVKAYELVESYGGVSSAKLCLYSEDLDHVKYNVALWEAIYLVEECL